MSWLARLESWVARDGGAAQGRATFGAAVATTTSTTGDVTTPTATTWRARSVARQVAMAIPAMRRARAAILTPATFGLVAFDVDGTQLSATDPRAAWLRQPERFRARFNTLSYLLDDGLWHDKSVFRVERDIAGNVSYVERIHPQRWQPVYAPNDPDTVEGWHVDHRPYSLDEFLAAGFVAFDFSGLGGLRMFGYELIQLYADLQAAAGRYARAPHPHAILQNVSGDELTRDEIAELLDEWEWARENRSIGYLDGYEYKAQGWNAKELQLTEAREHAALEVARMTNLPAFAVDAKGGDSMTYSNIVDRRKDLVESLRPWTTAWTQTLSMDVRLGGVRRGLVMPRGVTVATDPSDYLREDAAARMGIWAAGRDLELWNTEDIRRMEPLARRIA